MARARRGGAARPRRRSRRRGQLDLRASCSLPRAPAAARSRARGAAPGQRGRDRAAGRALDFARRCTPACCSARSRCRSTCASPRRARARSPRARCAAASSEPLARGAGRRGDLAACARATTSTRTARRDPHLRHHARRRRPVELTYGNLLWSALGSAVALGLDPSERWLCALPLSHVGGLSILLRSAIYATTAVVHERFETERVLRRAARAGDDARQPRRDDARAAARRGPRAPARAALRADRRRPGAGRAARSARAAPACRSATTYGLTEACSQVTTTPARRSRRGAASAGPPLFCTRVRIAADGEILVAGPTVAPRGARRATAGCTPATWARSTSAAGCRSPGARPTRSSPAARTSRRPRSRRCSRPTRACSRRRSSAAPDERVGRGGHGHRSCARPG